jgi:hypothetical protein
MAQAGGGDAGALSALTADHEARMKELSGEREKEEAAIKQAKAERTELSARVSRERDNAESDARQVGRRDIQLSLQSHFT